MVEVTQPLADLQHGELSWSRWILPRRREIAGELFEIAGVITQRVRRGVLQAQIGKIPVYSDSQI
jgi:hypothetical protein